MKEKTAIHRTITFFIGTVWVANGLFCKVLNLVPRHERIVGRILGDEHAVLLTKVIGVAEISMAIWILSGIKTHLNAAIQILIIATMNSIEFVAAPDLLLWGKVNAIFAFIFILLIYYNEFVLNKKVALQA